jgi:hypothetical protein
MPADDFKLFLAGRRRWTLEPCTGSPGKNSLNRARPVITKWQISKLKSATAVFSLLNDQGEYWQDERVANWGITSYGEGFVIFLPSAHESGLLTECSQCRIIPLADGDG